MYAAFSNPTRNIAKEVPVIGFFKFEIDESSQRHALGKHLSHRCRKTINRIISPVPVVLIDETAQRHTRKLIEQRQHRLPDGTAYVFKVNVDAGRASCC